MSKSVWLIKNKRDEFLTFDESLKDDPVDLSVKNEILDRYFQYGGVAQGDGKFSTRKISFKFDLIYKDSTNFRYNLNRIVSFFNIIDEPFYLINPYYNLRCRVRLNKIKPNYRQGLEQLVSIDTEIELENLTGLFETNTPLNSTISDLANNDTFSLDISIEALEANSIMTFTTSTGCSEFALLNSSTGENFQIIEPAFITGATIKVDNENGLVYLNDNLRPLIMKAGSFMKLRNGTNNFTFQTPTVGIVSIDISYREAFSY